MCSGWRSPASRGISACSRTPASWQKSAKALAESIDADVVDDNGRPLSDASFASIGGDLGQLYSALEGHDLAAGSAAARRLFS